jgi:uncharacterized membrane protein YccC
MYSDRGINEQLRWIIAKENPLSMSHLCLASTAALVSSLIATLFRLPEAYWAPMSTLIVMHHIHCRTACWGLVRRRNCSRHNLGQ